MNKLFRALPTLAILAAFSASLIAQSTNPPPQTNGQGQGQTQGQGQNGQGNQGKGTGTGTGQVEDPLDQLRQGVKGNSLQPNEKGLTVDPVGIVKASVGTAVRFQARARVNSIAPTTVVFSLNNGPDGASIDPYSGWFTWVPMQPGSFSFDIIATDAITANRNASTRVVVNVERRLEPFGYSFFSAPRAAIQARFLLSQTGPYRPGIPIQAGGQPGESVTLPDGTQISAATLAAIRAIQSNGSGFQLPPGIMGTKYYDFLSNLGGSPSQTPPNTQNQNGGLNGNIPLGGNGGGNGNGAAVLGGGANGLGGLVNNGTNGNQGQGNGQGNATGTGNTATGNPPVNPLPNVTGGSTAPYQFGQDTSLVPRTSAPNSQTYPTAQISPQLIDALRYFVGPFDMMGSNVFVPSPDRYQLGPGDVLIVRYGSPTMEVKEVTVAVDERGSVVVPPSGRKVTIRGKSLDAAEQLIRQTIGKDVLNPEVSVTLKELRTMSLTVIGDAYQPGSYQVPAVATLFNALYMVGGPADTGSLRNIELRRSDGSRKTFDMYQFLIYGDAKQDVPLQPGDTIFIPVSGPRVRVQGEVGRPGIYEMRVGETLKTALKFAGEAKATGVTQRVGHTTVDPGRGLILRDVNVEDKTPEANPPVFADDIIEVYSVRPVLTNLVTLDGAVDQPGQYALTEGMTIKSLIDRARGPLPEANMARADLFRQNADKTLTLIPIDLGKAMAGDPSQNVKLELYDRVRVYRVDEIQWMGDRQVTVKGAVRRPGNYARADRMRVADLLIQAGGPDGDAFLDQAFVQRVNPDNTMGELIRVDLRRVALGDQNQNIELKDRDTLIIQTVAEAKYVPEQSVRILGAVQAPGEFAAASNMRVRDLIQLAGGVMPNAAERVEVARARVVEGTPAESYKLEDVLAGTVDPTLNPGDLVTIATRSDIQLTTRYVVILGGVMRPGTYAINSTTDKITDIIQRAGGLAPNAFARGAQFVRDPKKLQTLFQASLTPRMREVLNIIAEDEYLRAAAKAQVEIARIQKSVNQGNPSISIPGLPTVSQSNGGTAEIKFDKETVTRVRDLRKTEVEPAGNLSIRLEDALKNTNSPHNLVMEQGDILIIPDKPSTVFVSGAVFNPQSTIFEPGKNLNFYLNKAGGIVPDGDTRLILIIRANGEVIKARGGTRVELGDMIFVPTKVMAARLSDRQSEIDAVSRNITSAGLIFTIIRAIGGG